MKTCKSCGFDNPDAYRECLQCGDMLQLTIPQAQENYNRFVKLTDNLAHDESELLDKRDSWQYAMAHRFDWIWDIGRRIMMFETVLGSLIILSLAVLTMVMTVIMVERFS